MELDKTEHKTQEILVKKAQNLAHRKDRVFYLNAAILTVYGWQVAIPVLLGIILGRFLDKNFAYENLSWTLNLIILGFVIGCINATKWVKREGKLERKHK